MSARSISKGVLDARFKKLQALAGMGGSASGLLPLSRTSFVDGGRTGGQDGSIAEPYHAIQTWLNALSPTGVSVADNTAFELGLVMPCLAGYTENLTIPAYRNIEIRSENLQFAEPPWNLNGNVVWRNTVAAGGAHAPPFATTVFHNFGINGTVTVTDDATVSEELFFCADELGSEVVGLVDTHLATDLAIIGAINYSFATGITSTTGATGAVLGFSGSGTLAGTYTCLAMSVDGCAVSASAINVGNGSTAGVFVNTVFTGTNTVITGLSGSILTFDGASWRSFREAGGSVVTSVVLVIGGYSAGDKPGANLTNADVSVALNGSGATAGFTGANSGNHYTLPTGTLTGNHTVTLLTAGALVGDSILITRFDATANTYTVKDDAGTTIAVLPASQKGSVLATYNGTHFVFTSGGAGLT